MQETPVLVKCRHVTGGDAAVEAVAEDPSPVQVLGVQQIQLPVAALAVQHLGSGRHQRHLAHLGEPGPGGGLLQGVGDAAQLPVQFAVGRADRRRQSETCSIDRRSKRRKCLTKRFSGVSKVSSERSRYIR